MSTYSTPSPDATARRAFYLSAYADAVGDSFEFLPSPDPDAVRAEMSKTQALEFTDDTQMTLFGAESLAEGVSAGYSSADLLLRVRQGYLEWLTTQEGWFSLSEEPGLIGMLCMHRRKAPGTTCLSALRHLSVLRSLTSVEEAKNTSNGCGTVMRQLPFALAAHLTGEWDLYTALALGAAKITHAGDEIELTTRLYMEVAREYTRPWGGTSLLERELGRISSITEFGEGWTALSCLMMAVYAVEASHGSLTDCLLLSICHKGDSDSVAAVAGGLFALRWPLAAAKEEDAPLQALARGDFSAVDYTAEKFIKAFWKG